MNDLALDAAQLDRLSALGSPVLEPVDVAPPPWKMSLGGPILVVVGLAVGVGAWVASREGATTAEAISIGGMAALLLGGGLASLVLRAGRRCRVQLYDRGVAVTRRGRTEAMAYDDLADLRLDEQDVLANGHPVGTRRRLALGGRTGKLSLVAIARLGQIDALGARLPKLLEDATATLDRRRKAGEPLQGDGWSLDADALVVKGRRVPIAELAAVGVFGGRVVVWKGRDDEPFFSTGLGGRNARVLGMLVTRLVTPREEDRSSLGRVLFRRRGSKVLAAFVALLALPTLAGGVVLVSGGTDVVPGIGVIVLGALLMVPALMLWMSRFEARERGLEKRTLFGRRVLRYDEIDRFSYSSVKYYHNGAYAGTSLRLAFFPEKGRPVKVSSSTTKATDADLERLREGVARAVAARLVKRVESGEEVAWGSARLSRDGLKFQQKKLFGKGEWRSVPFTTPMLPLVEKGKLRLTLVGESGVAFELGANAENFYPGLEVFSTLVTRARAAAEPS